MESITGPVILFAGLCYIAFNLRKRTAIPSDYMVASQYPVSAAQGNAGGSSQEEIARNLAIKQYEEDKRANVFEKQVENVGNVNKAPILRVDQIV